MIHYNGLISVISKCKLQLYPIDPVCLLNTGFEYLLTFHRHTLLVCSLVFDILTTNREKKKMEKNVDLVEIYSVSAEKIISDAFSYSENV